MATVTAMHVHAMQHLSGVQRPRGWVFYIVHFFLPPRCCPHIWRRPPRMVYAFHMGWGGKWWSDSTLIALLDKVEARLFVSSSLLLLAIFYLFNSAAMFLFFYQQSFFPCWLLFWLANCMSFPFLRPRSAQLSSLAHPHTVLIFL